jgi:hypothetical protein
MWRRAGVAAPAVALLLAGCGGGGAAAQIRAKVEQFSHATATHDYRLLCNRVLAPALLADLAQGGIGCEQALRVALAGVRRPRLTIGSIEVEDRGRRALVLTVSQAAGEQDLLASLELVRTVNGWRVASLGGGSR